VIGAIGFLLCAQGTPSIYYGTEQGFTRQRRRHQMREAMYDQGRRAEKPAEPECRIYEEIARIADVMRRHDRSVRTHVLRQIAGESLSFGFPSVRPIRLPSHASYTGQEILVAYNVSEEARHDRVIVDATLPPTLHR